MSHLQAKFKGLRQWLEQEEPLFTAAAGVLAVRRTKSGHLASSSRANGLNFCSKTLTEPWPVVNWAQRCLSRQFQGVSAVPGPFLGILNLVMPHPLGTPGNSP